MKLKSLLFALPIFCAAQMALAQTYQVDPTHASIMFKVDHLGYSNVFGLITESEGKFTFDEAKPEKSSFEVKAKTESIFTGVKKRDDHLKGPDFFNAKQFPWITMKSKSVKKAGANEYQVTADLTMNGVTKPVNFTFKRWKTAKDPWGKNRTGGETTFKLKRTDFGMNYMSKPGEIGDEIELTISIEGVQ